MKFSKKGEEFLKIEKNISLKILKKNKSVISLGGGAFQNNEIRKEVLNGNISIWLKWNYQTLLKRIIDKPHRPLAYNIEKKELIELMKKRSKFYKKALYKINCEDLTKNKIINKILNINNCTKIVIGTKTQTYPIFIGKVYTKNEISFKKKSQKF